MNSKKQTKITYYLNLTTNNHHIPNRTVSAELKSKYSRSGRKYGEKLFKKEEKHTFPIIYEEKSEKGMKSEGGELRIRE